MTDKSINASERLETQEKAWWGLIWGPVETRMRDLGMYDPDYKPNNAPASGITSQDSIERAID